MSLDLGTIVVIYVPAAVLTLVLMGMLWKNAQNTRHVLSHYGREMEAERSLRHESEQWHFRQLQARDEQLERLQREFRALVSQLVQVPLGGPPAPAPSYRPEERPEVASPEMSPAEYPDGESEGG